MEADLKTELYIAAVLAKKAEAAKDRVKAAMAATNDARIAENAACNELNIIQYDIDAVMKRILGKLAESENEANPGGGS